MYSYRSSQHVCAHACVATAMKLISEHRTYNIKTFNEIRESHDNQGQVHREFRSNPPVAKGPALIADLLRVISDCSELVTFITLRELHASGIFKLLVHVVDLLLINSDFRGLENWSLNEGQVGVTKTAINKSAHLPDKSAEEPDEGLFELVVRLGRDIVVLEVLLSVESDLLGLNLSVLDVNLVSDENNGNVLANADEILVPLGNILVGDARAHIEHDDGAVSTDAMKLCVNLINSAY